ncbi:hypothetical protein [Pyrodictium abyssi]|uniref:Uncharacterized protein n=1 Tax=Pyrodictium abyssi TaxID=54256 RepID=A0ABM8IXD7_9CREN|nr:hypothetical protein PABY_10790 [Pyrodictium abyssi]
MEATAVLHLAVLLYALAPVAVSIDNSTCSLQATAVAELVEPLPGVATGYRAAITICLGPSTATHVEARLSEAHAYIVPLQVEQLNDTCLRAYTATALPLNTGLELVVDTAGCRAVLRVAPPELAKSPPPGGDTSSANTTPSQEQTLRRSSQADTIVDPLHLLNPEPNPGEPPRAGAVPVAAPTAMKQAQVTGVDAGISAARPQSGAEKRGASSSLAPTLLVIGSAVLLLDYLLDYLSCSRPSWLQRRGA